MPLSREQELAATIALAAGAGDLSLAGGSALIVHGLIDRTTKDIDAFTRSLRADVDQIADRVAAALQAADYSVRDVSVSAMRRLQVSRQRRGPLGRKPDEVQIEIGLDYQALPALPSRLGPILDPRELAANKILAIYDRNRARDADDLARLVAVLSWKQVLEVANLKQVEPMDPALLAESLRRFRLIRDAEFPFPQHAPSVKEYMNHLADCVEAGGPPTVTGPYGEPRQE